MGQGGMGQGGQVCVLLLLSSELHVFELHLIACVWGPEAAPNVLAGFSDVQMKHKSYTYVELMLRLWLCRAWAGVVWAATSTEPSVASAATHLSQHVWLLSVAGRVRAIFWNIQVLCWTKWITREHMHNNRM